MQVLVGKLQKSFKANRKLDQHATPESGHKPPTPFRFMELPKEVRLLVYENLGTLECTRVISLVGGHHICLDSTFLVGISILTVNRQVYEEASAILAPVFRELMKKPPKIRISERNLLPFVRTHLQSRPKEDLLDIMLKAASHEPTLDIIHKFRAQYSRTNEDLEKLQVALGLKNIIDTRLGYGSINAIATFILRCVEFKELFEGLTFEPNIRYPPVVIFLEISDFTTVQPITFTKSRAQWLLGHFRPGSNRLKTVQYRSNCSLIAMFTHQRLRATDEHQFLSYLLALDYRGPIRELDEHGFVVQEGGVDKVAMLVRWAFEACIKVSVDRYGKRGEGLIGNGGTGRDYNIFN